MYSQLILSKALERSSLRSIPGVLVFYKEWITSWARMTLSRICLPSTYPDCSGDMIDGKIGLSLLAITFVRSL